ncbi:MAG: BTAD domain-containing putative transcriptional regulator, partial [Acidimicrobiia bacterium]|nr:BTAD domain-containing putative transcriptional regulator [Acidimicrobiia bacterium]
AAKLGVEDPDEALELVASALRMVKRYRLEHVLAPHASLHRELLELGLADPELAETAENLAALTRRVETHFAVTAEPLRLRARLFGDLDVSLSGRPVPVWTWRSKKAVSLLALLLHHRGDPVHRDQAIEAIWPEGDPKRGSKNLNVALTATRRGLEQVHPDGSQCLRRQGSFYRIAPEVIEWLDAEEFLDLAAEASNQAGAGDLEAAVRAADQALELAGEEYLASEPYADWTARERARLSELAADLSTRSAEWLLDLDETDRALVRARAALTRQPLRERAWLVLMRAYLSRGDRVTALNTYEECAAVFADQLGIDPSAELRNLAAFLRR